MGSKKSAASKKRKGDAASSSREPFEDEPLTTLYLLAHDIGNFGSRQRYEDFKTFMDERKVLGERVFKESILNSIHFPFTGRLQAWGWHDFMLDESTRILTDVVKSFYFNATGYRDYIESSFHGKVYRITRKDIADALGPLVTPGDRIYKPPGDFQWVEACRDVWADNRIRVMQSKIERMPLAHRVVHLMVAQAIHPKKGSYDRVDPIEVWLVHRIINNQPFDLVEVVLGQILHAMNQCLNTSNNYSLPYGKLLTRIIRRKVKSVNNDDVSAPWQMGPLDLQSVQRMGWKLDPHTNTWRRKEELAQEAAVEAADEDFNPQADEMEEDDAEEDDAEEAQEEQGPQAEGGFDPRAGLANRLNSFILSQEDFNDYRINNIEDQMLTRFERLSMENEYLRMQNDYQIALLTSMRQPDQAPPTPLAAPPEYPPLAYSNRYSPAPNPYYYPDAFHPNSPPYNPDA